MSHTEFDISTLSQFSQDPGVYLMKNRRGEVIYIGKANNLRRRIKSYFSAKKEDRFIIPFLIKEISSIEVIVVFNEREALLLENTLIKQHQPKFNLLLKDDKSFIGLVINPKSRWPRLKLMRTRGKLQKEELYFGPYTNASAARQTLELMASVFLLRQCSDQELARRKRPCLLYGMKRCTAPCIGKCTEKEYQAQVESAIEFLKGHDKKVLQEWYDEMKEASDALNFERAAFLLAKIRQIEHVVQSKNFVVMPHVRDCDALAVYHREGTFLMAQLFFREGKLIGSEHYYFPRVIEGEEEVYTSFLLQYYQGELRLGRVERPAEIYLPLELSSRKTVEEILGIPILYPRKGDKRQLVIMAQKNAEALFQREKEGADRIERTLIELQEVLRLNSFPHRVVCFDISNTSGRDAVASMVQFDEGKVNPSKSLLFHMDDTPRGDDPAALAQAVERYLKRIEKVQDLPDLLIVDGGKNQLQAVMQVFKTLDIATVDLISIAKEKGKHHKMLTHEKIFLSDRSTEPVLLPEDSSVLFFLQKVRDEAHRKALQFHRKKRERRTLASSLDHIPGIGSVKRKRLMTHFGTVERIASASEEDFEEVEGITRADVDRIRKIMKRD